MPAETAVSIVEVTDMLHRLYSRVNVPDAEREVLIDTLLDAELRGIKTHGLMRVPLYYNNIAGRTVIVPTLLEICSEQGAVTVYDGHDGLGQWLAWRGMQTAMVKADQFGIGAATVRNSQHFGTAGYYAKLATDRNMIGLVFTNASPRLAPWGGTSKLFGNNPWAVGIPTHDPEIPFVLDIANSVSSAGRIWRALKNGETIPLDWALNERGEFTSDPQEALRGTLLPFGQHKGYGVTFAVSALSALLSGGTLDPDVLPMNAEGKPQHVSHFFIAVRIDFFQPLDEFKQCMKEMIERVHHSEKMPDVERIFYPGERGYERKSKQLRRGAVQMDANVWAEIERLVQDKR